MLAYLETILSVLSRGSNYSYVTCGQYLKFSNSNQLTLFCLEDILAFSGGEVVSPFPQSSEY